MITVDKEHLDREMAKLHKSVAAYAAFVGMGMSEAVAQQTGLLMADLAQHEPPRSKAALEERIERDGSRVFAPFDSNPLRSAAGGDFVWTATGPQFLIGTPRPNFQPDMAASDMPKPFYAAAGSPDKPYTRKYTQLGRRGKQTVWRLNRILVDSMSLVSFNNVRKKAVGKLKASFATAWSVLKPRQRLDDFVMAHITARDAKGSFVDGLADKDHPSFTIISRSPGCTKPRSLYIIKEALRIRVDKMVTYARYKMRKQKEPAEA